MYFALLLDFNFYQNDVFITKSQITLQGFLFAFAKKSVLHPFLLIFPFQGNHFDLLADEFCLLLCL